MFYVTGLFSCARSISNDSQILLPVPKKTRIGELLPIGLRPNLLGQKEFIYSVASGAFESKFERFAKSAKRFAEASNSMLTNDSSCVAKISETIAIESDNYSSDENSLPNLLMLYSSKNFSADSNSKTIRNTTSSSLAQPTILPRTELEILKNVGQSVKLPVFVPQTPPETPPEMQAALISACKTPFETPEIGNPVAEQNIFNSPLASYGSQNVSDSDSESENNRYGADCMDRIINANIILSNDKFKQKLKDAYFDVKDFDKKNENDTLRFIMQALLIEEADAKKIIRIFRKELSLFATKKEEKAFWDEIISKPEI